MRFAVSAGVVLLCVGLPSALLFWLLRTHAQSRVHFASVALLTAVVLVVLKFSVLGGWYSVGAFWPWVFAVAFLGILSHRLLRGLPSAWLPRPWSRELLLTGLNALLIALWSAFLPLLTRARAYQGEPLALSAPLRGGTFAVMGGGANWSVNHHAFIAYQRYALDILELDALGFRASGMSPSDLDAYRIFGAEIVAPCDGEVLWTENDLPNRPLLDPDTSELAGNHVVLFCSGHSVLLAHMQPGSVAVNVGQQVTTGQKLGTVGNSGSTMEPHLHIHAVEGRHADAKGTATPLLIDGAFLIKGGSFAN